MEIVPSIADVAGNGLANAVCWLAVRGYQAIAKPETVDRIRLAVQDAVEQRLKVPQIAPRLGGEALLVPGPRAQAIRHGQVA